MKKMLFALFVFLSFSLNALAGVNINTATQAELESLKDIGPVKAQAIIDYRKKNGNFKSVDDLEKVNGIGPGIMKAIRNDVSVNGQTTVTVPQAKAAGKSDKPVKETKKDTTKDTTKAVGTEKAAASGKVADTKEVKGTTEKKSAKATNEMKADTSAKEEKAVKAEKKASAKKETDVKAKAEVKAETKAKVKTSTNADKTTTDKKE